MADAKTLDLDWSGEVAIIRMNDPATLNAVTLSMIDAFDRALDEVASRARALIVTGAGKGFCSGANLAGGLGVGERPADPSQSDGGLVLETHINPLMSKLRDLPVPWISSVRGAAAGVGASIALAADLVVASETAFFLQAFARIGLVPDGGSSHLLVRTIGRPRAMELMLLGDRLPARTALEWGLINRLVADADLETASLELATRLAQGAASLKLIRKLAWTAVDGEWSKSLATEREFQRNAGRTADHREGVAAVLGKRPASFKGA
jgi:2-(1,2-epoxy-1,2-dihydrophenyl)acetyl-CoA isomerase